MSEQRQIARRIIDAVIEKHGQEVFLGEGYAPDETLADGIVTALASQPAPSGWQPIETCPRKPGTEYLLRVKVRAGIPFGKLVGHWMPGGHCIEDHPPIDGGWYFWNGCMFDIAAEPTHWMPLPAVDALPPAPEVKA